MIQEIKKNSSCSYNTKSKITGAKGIRHTLSNSSCSEFFFLSTHRNVSRDRVLRDSKHVCKSVMGDLISLLRYNIFSNYRKIQVRFTLNHMNASVPLITGGHHSVSVEYIIILQTRIENGSNPWFKCLAFDKCLYIKAHTVIMKHNLTLDIALVPFRVHSQ